MTDYVRELANRELEKMEKEKQQEREKILERSNRLIPAVLSDYITNKEITKFKIEEIEQ